MLDILLFFVGLIIGLLIFNLIILPLFYGIPKTIFWIRKGELTKWAIWHYIRIFIFSNIFFVAIALLLTNFFPREAFYNSAGFIIGQWVGIGYSFIYALTKKGRTDLNEDFWAKMQKYAQSESKFK